MLFNDLEVAGYLYNPTATPETFFIISSLNNEVGLEQEQGSSDKRVISAVSSCTS